MNSLDVHKVLFVCFAIMRNFKCVFFFFRVSLIRHKGYSFTH